MNDFTKYYNEQFRQDIQTFFSKVPERSKHTFDDRTNFPPRDIFGAFNYSRNKEKIFEAENVKFYKAFNEAKPIMKNETIDFFRNYLNEINGKYFWKKCEQELCYDD